MGTRVEKQLFVKDGDIVRYHPIIDLPEHVVVKVTGDPYQLASGDWLVRVENLETGKVHRPWLCALTLNIGPAVAPQKSRRRKKR